MHTADYARPGLPVASDDERVEFNRQKATYTTWDIWQACFLHLEGVELVGVVVGNHGRATWLFDNRDDRGWQTGRRFRQGGVTVEIDLLREAYRTMSRAVSRARRGENTYGPTTG